MTLAALLSAITRRALLRTLRATRGNRAASARELDVSPRKLQRLLATHTTPAELGALAQRHGWPTRVDLAAHARASRQRGSNPAPPTADS